MKYITEDDEEYDLLHETAAARVDADTNLTTFEFVAEVVGIDISADVNKICELLNRIETKLMNKINEIESNI